MATLWLSTIWSLGGDEAGVDVVAGTFVPLTAREIYLPGRMSTGEKRRSWLASGGNTSLVPENRGGVLDFGINHTRMVLLHADTLPLHLQILI